MRGVEPSQIAVTNWCALTSSDFESVLPVTRTHAYERKHASEDKAVDRNCE
jgi:hypothetical protein